jgi:glutathione synthase/RimK-type ligase-like ATP-grasp enzyme
MWPEALWISNFQAIQRAGMKPLQLGIAREVGFNVPETIFASGASAAQQFLERHPICIAKPQSMAMPEGKQLGAKLIKKGDTLNFDGLRNDPYILQRYIEPHKEYRVTVVGERVFAAAIQVNRSRTERTYRDWRKGYADPSFRIVAATLAPELTQACRRLVYKLGLEYGAIDLIEDPEGKIWFIEINPNGQWAFVEKATGQPIGKAIADKLMHNR